MTPCRSRHNACENGHLSETRMLLKPGWENHGITIGITMINAIWSLKIPKIQIFWWFKSLNEVDPHMDPHGFFRHQIIPGGVPTDSRPILGPSPGCKSLSGCWSSTTEHHGRRHPRLSLDGWTLKIWVSFEVQLVLGNPSFWCHSHSLCVFSDFCWWTSRTMFLSLMTSAFFLGLKASTCPTFPPFQV